MIRDDQPTMPIPTSDAPTEAMLTQPNPTFAPHVPIADLRTADLTTVSADPTPSRRGAGLLLGVLGGIAVAAVVGTVVALTLLGPRETTAPAPSTSATPTPTPTVAIAPDPEPADPSTPAAPPPPVDPSPQPTTTTDPIPDPTPAETP